MKYDHNRPHDKVKHYKILKKRLSSQRGELCERCGYNRYDILQVHHRDRNRDNNDLENLELICPNCHAEEHFLNKKVENGGMLRMVRNRS